MGEGGFECSYDEWATEREQGMEMGMGREMASGMISGRIHFANEEFVSPESQLGDSPGVEACGLNRPKGREIRFTWWHWD